MFSTSIMINEAVVIIDEWSSMSDAGYQTWWDLETLCWHCQLIMFDCSMGKLSWRSENLIEKIVSGRWTHKLQRIRIWFLSASNDQGSRAMLAPSIDWTYGQIVDQCGTSWWGQGGKKRNFNQTLSLILQLTIYLSPPRPRRIKKVCMRMIHSIGWGGIKVNEMHWSRFRMLLCSVT